MDYFEDDSADGTKNKSKTASKNKNNGKKEIKPPKKISARYLYNSGLAYLQRFPASSMHFQSVMKRKIDKSCRHHVEQSKDDCLKMLDELVVQFQELGLLNDETYLKGMIISLRRRGLSSLQINNKLQQKGYKRNDIDEAIKQHDQETFETSHDGDIHAALIFARKKKLGPFDREQKRDPTKSLAIMARAGYSYDIAKKTLQLNTDDLPQDMRHLA